jgi:uncharacterized protein (DUF488 family)
MKSNTLFTIGYEGRTLNEFIEVLQKNSISILCDVRKNPVSRKKGFSKNQLREAVAAKHIEYKHFPELGIATELRKDTNITTEKLFAIYREEILRTTAAINALKDLIELLKKESAIAITCYELDHNDCHRSHLAMAIQNLTKFKIINL